MPQAKGTLTLILGGVRSGKSRFGEELAKSLGGDAVLYVATAQAHDSEMKHRIAQHQATRPNGWRTLECCVGVGEALLRDDALSAIDPTDGREVQVVLLDCLTLLVTNRLCELDLDQLNEHEVDQLHATIRNEMQKITQFSQDHALHMIVVSGEVGLGIVPEYKSGRVFRDALGWANQYLARHADAVYAMMAGLAIPVHERSVSSTEACEFLKSQTRRLPVSPEKQSS